MKKYIIQNCELYLADCVDVLNVQDANSFDAIITDPPYGYLKHELDIAFNEATVFGNWQRLLKDDKLIAVFGFGDAFHRWNVMLKDLKFTFKETLVWEKTQVNNPYSNMARTVEFVTIRSKGNAVINKSLVDFFDYCVSNDRIDSLESHYKRLRSALNSDKEIEIIKQYLEKGIIDYNTERKVKHNLTSNNKTKTCSKSISTVKTLKYGKREMSVIRCRRDSNYKHPTQKPLELMERIIKLTTKENNLVLDPFLGGGSTAVACINTNRRFVGIEINKKYFDIACQRIEDAYKSI